MDGAAIPAEPWRYPSLNFSYYTAGQKYVDPTCEEMARYAARYVGWYTAGGFTDECGHHHASGLHYQWELLSVLNEHEHRILLMVVTLSKLY